MPSRSQVQENRDDSSPTLSKLDAVKRLLQVIDIENEEDQHYIVNVLGINSIQRILKISSYTLGKMRKDGILTTGDIDQFETAMLWVKDFKRKHNRGPTPQDIFHCFTEEMWENFEPASPINDAHDKPGINSGSSSRPIKIEDGGDIDPIMERDERKHDLPSEISTTRRTSPSMVMKKMRFNEHHTTTSASSESSSHSSSSLPPLPPSLAAGHGVDGFPSSSFDGSQGGGPPSYYNSSRGSARSAFDRKRSFDVILDEEINSMLKRRAEQFGSDDPKVIQWRIRFHQLESFKDKYGNYDIPEYDPNYRGLLDWLHQQRIIHAGKGEDPGILTASARIQFFESIGILEFSKPDDEDRSWEEHFKALVKFKADYGHCMVPASYRTLSEWLENQRNDYKIFVRGSDYEDSNLTVQRCLKLEGLGFIWNTNVDEAKWTSKYKHLKNFKQQYNHCNVTWADGRYRELGFWVAAQRAMNRVRSEGRCDLVDFFTNRHRELLDELGFKWKESNPFIYF